MWAGRLEEAAKYLETALSKFPDFYESAWKLTEVYSELGDLEKALASSEKAIAAAPSARIKAISNVKRAYLYWRFGRIKEAVNAVDLAINTDPGRFVQGLKAGEIYKAIGDTAAARRIHRSFFNRYKSDMARGQSDHPPFEGDALSFLLEAELPEAEVIQVLESVLTSDVDPLLRETCLASLGTLYLRAGDYEKASRSSGGIKKFFEIIAKFPPGSRNAGWKYAIENIRLEPRRDAPDYEIPNQLIEVARKAERKDMEFIARFLKAQYHAKYDRLQELGDEYRALGAPLESQWRIIGPFENLSGFDRQYPPEESIDLSATYQIPDGQIRWRPASDGAYDGYVNLREVLKRSSWAVGYGLVYVDSPAKRVVQLRVGSDEAAKLWLNDKLVWQTYRKQSARLDEHMITVALRPGDNKLLIKVTNTDLDWGFYLRVTDENGEGYPDLKFHPPTERETALNTLSPELRMIAQSQSAE